MTLAHLIILSEDDVICDLAETYNILNYRELSPSLVATLVLGLREDSRIKKRVSEVPINLNQMLMALMVDNLQFLSWSKTKSAQRNQNKPDSIYRKLMKLDEKQKDDLMSFENPEDFEAYMNEIRGNSNG